jgi:hypothetical protein
VRPRNGQAGAYEGPVERRTILIQDLDIVVDPACRMRSWMMPNLPM